MRQIINSLAIVLLFANIVFAQNKGTLPIKKTVTSKITKDAKTGKVVKTIVTTTTTTTDVILVEGTKAQPIIVKKPVASVNKPIVKAKVTAAKPKVIATKPKVIVKPVQVVAKPVEVEKPKEVVNNDTGSIFANPTDKSASTAPEAEKPVVPVKVVAKPNPVPKKEVINANGVIGEKKVFKEGKSQAVLNYYGLRLGANLATVQSAPSLSNIANPTDANKFGLTGGIFYNLGITRAISIQPEVNFSQQGFKVVNGIDTDLLKNTAINVPVLLKLAVGGSKFKVFVNGGPYAGLLLNSLRTKENFSNEAINTFTKNKLDYGVQTGAGLQFDLGGAKLEIEGRYNYGMADPNKYIGTKPSYIGDTGKNRIMTGTIGLAWPIGK
jgi:hypothetical protein